MNEEWGHFQCNYTTKSGMCLLVCSGGKERETGRERKAGKGAGHGKEDSKKNYLRARKSPDNPGR